MPEYAAVPQKFFFAGVSDFPSDAMPEGKYPYVRNMRPYIDGSLTPRAGLTGQTDSALGSGIHSIFRLNDPTTFNGGVPAVRVLGAGTEVWRGDQPGTAYSLIDSGYSGDPLVSVTAQPPQSPRPWIYLADSLQFRKFTTDGVPYDVGLAQASLLSSAPQAALDVQHISSNDIQTSTAWAAAGTVATAGGTGTRINTTISQILYDDAVTNTGYASIVPADPINITTGTLVTVGAPAGVFENALITDVTIAVAATTVGNIIYDVGSTGLCTIEPVGSLGVGQLDAPPIEAYRRRAFRQQATGYQVATGDSTDLPPAPDTTAPTRRIRQVDFPVNAIVILNGTETVRILSVAVGPDGVQSFRCTTSTTITAGATITGLAGFRIYLASTWAPGSGILRQLIQNTLTYPAPASGEKAKMTGGIQSVYAINLAQFSNGQAVLPEDELHLAIKIDRLTEVVSVRVYIDVDATTNDFLQNYYFHEWRASDIITAIQGTNAINVTPLVDARKTVVANQQLEWVKAPGFKTQRRPRTMPGKPEIEWVPAPGFKTGRRPVLKSTRQPVAASAIATQLALGNNQWIDLRVKIGTLVHVGTDPTRTLADAKAFEILVACEGPQADVTPEPIAVQYSDLQIYGGGGVDVGEVGDPVVYVYRYRSSQTGAVSNPSPANRGGLIPRRQDVLLTPVVSADPQVDRIDWFRIGGALSEYTYFGTGPNTTTPFRDRYMDASITGGEIISYDNFQPWPLQDLPRTGTCDAAGTAIRRTSGDAFNTAWAPGSVILVNGRATTLYASPTSASILHVTDSVGYGSGLEYVLPGPTLMSQKLGRCWGPYQNFYFACGDQINPGTLYWTNGNNIEATSDANSLIVTSPSEPLMNGGVQNAFAFVFSSEDLYMLRTDGSGLIRADKTPCGRGLWTPWSFCIAPEGIYFLAKDGLFLTAWGSPAEPVHMPDLRNVFPKDGIAGEVTNNIPAPDMSQSTRLRLSYIAGLLYFDYAPLT